MSKSQSKQKLGDRILACLEEGEKDISEIQEAVGASKNSVSVCLTGLVKSGKVVRVRSGVYRLASTADATVEPARRWCQQMRRWRWKIRAARRKT